MSSLSRVFEIKDRIKSIVFPRSHKIFVLVLHISNNPRYYCVLLEYVLAMCREWHYVLSFPVGSSSRDMYLRPSKLIDFHGWAMMEENNERWDIVVIMNCGMHG